MIGTRRWAMMSLQLAGITLVLFLLGCDKLKFRPVPDDTGAGTQDVASTPAPQPEQPPIPVVSWTQSEQATSYRVRKLEDGTPGLFNEHGKLLLKLMPRLILDMDPAGAGRTRPRQEAFELVRLTPHEDGGFSLFAHYEDRNGKYYDLRIENAGGDPRLHVALNTKFARDVDVYREVLVFETGAVKSAQALAYDYAMRPIEDEYINSVHTPDVATFGEGETAFSILGRIGIEGLTVHRHEDKAFLVELEVFHAENHPLEFQGACGQLPPHGAARIASGDKLRARADIVLGPATFVHAARYPAHRKAAVVLTNPAAAEADALEVAQVYAAPKQAIEASVSTTRDRRVWFPRVAPLPCDLAGEKDEEEPKVRLGASPFRDLASRGYEVVWSGRSLQPPAEGLNVLAPTEADARRAVAFTHPNALRGPAQPLEFFSGAEVDLEWARSRFSEEQVDRLAAEHGAAALLVDFASATQPEPESWLSRLRARDDVWLASPGDLSRHLVGVSDLEFDYLPQGVVRIRNPSMRPVESLTVRLPSGVEARLPEPSVFTKSEGSVAFRLGARQEQILQLMRDGEPIDVLAPARVVVEPEQTAEDLATPERP